MTSPADLERALLDPPIESRPEVRWWLAAACHTDATLRNEIETAHSLGFGGMEFLAMPEANIDLPRYGWGSEEWLHDSKLIVEETTKRGMSVSFTSGANWSNANLPTIDPEHPAAAKELDYVYEDINSGETRSGNVPRIDLKSLFRKGEDHPFDKPAEVKGQSLVAVVAARIADKDKDGNAISLHPETVDLTKDVAGEALQWTAPGGHNGDRDRGEWRVFYFWTHGTGQTAQPSSSVNYTVNYMDPDGCEALIDYWKRVVFTPDLLRTLSQNDRAQMYMDSLELTCHGAGGLFWGHTVEAEFKKRRGYSVIPYLPFLVRVTRMMACDSTFTYEPSTSSTSGRTIIDKVRFDIVSTFTDLYIENMLRPFRAFLNSVNVKLRSEISYGLPFELSRPGTEVDGVETESLEFASQIDAYRLLAGVAHLFGKQYSSETGATTRNFMLSQQFYDQIINTQLAVGCTKTVLHGWASMAGAEGTQWPGHEGMWPMFSERFDYRQPGSEFYGLWCKALGRTQHVLRQGKPRIDVGILRTDHATDNLIGFATRREDGTRISDEEAYGKMWMRNRENHWWQDLGMQDAGWTYEFFDGQLLRDPRVKMEGGVVQPEGPGYQALIIYQSALNPDVAKHVLDWARAGLRVLLVHNTSEVQYLAENKFFHYPSAASRTQGLDGRDAELANTIKELLKLPNAAEIKHQAETVEALRRLGVRGRAEFERPNQSVVSHLREDGQRSYLYLYHFLYENGEPTDLQVSLAGEGAIHRIDTQAGSTTLDRASRAREGRTKLDVRLSPGETALFMLDRAVDLGSLRPANRSALTAAKLSEWDLTVESWDAGEVEVITEDRGLGYVSTEHKPRTAITKIEVGKVGSLLPWSAIPQVGPAVSGIGEYRTSFTLDSLEPGARHILDLGSTCGGLGSVSVNGSAPRGFDTSAPKVDVTDLLKQGQNDVVVRVSSSLNNRLLARGYYDGEQHPLMKALGEWRSEEEKNPVRQYGLVGPVLLSRKTWE